MAGKDLTNAPLASLRAADLDPQDRIAPNFLVYELSVSELADRRGIDNRIADDEALRSAVHLARHVLQPIRDAFGGFTPNSVYRSQALERQLKDKPASWISTSQHTEGRACDVEIVAKPTLELAQWASTNLAEFDQIICECYDPRKGPNSGWVHISLLPPGRGRNRRQVLSYVVDPGSGRLVYVNGLQPTMA
jgi:Peptidase M15